MKWTSQPTQRDQEIYQAVAIHLRSQREVAKLFGVSQGRVSQICSQMRGWLNVQMYSGASPAEDNFISAHELRLRLEDRMRLASEVFAESREQEKTEKVRCTRQQGRADVNVEESMTRSGRPNHHMFREMVRLDELHFQARLRESQFKAELVADQSQSRWWREESLVQRCLGVCRQVVMMYAAAVEAGVTLAALPPFELTSLLVNLREHVSQGELGEDLVAYLPVEWALVARQLGLVDEAEELASVEVVTCAESEVLEKRDLDNSANNANTTTVEADSTIETVSSKVVNRANETNNRDHKTGPSPATIPASTHLSPRDDWSSSGETRSTAVPGHHSESDEYQPELLAA